MCKRATALIATAICGAASARADVLFSANFDNLSLGTVNAQAGWEVVNGPENHGMIDEQNGNRFLRVAALGGGFGAGVRHMYDAPSSRRYVQVMLDFSADNVQWPFYFMDQFPADDAPPDAIFWEQTVAYAANGTLDRPIQLNTWHPIAIEIDTQLRGVIGVNFGNGWIDEVDATVSPARALTGFVFAGYSFDTAHPDLLYWLSIDNIRITDSDAPFVPSAGATALLTIAGAVFALRRR